MKVRLVQRPEVFEDMMEIYLTIGLDNTDAAERVYEAIEDQIRRLAQFPRTGARRPELGTAIRMVVQGMYLIFYEINPDTDEGPVDTVEVIRVVHGYRDLSRIF